MSESEENCELKFVLLRAGSTDLEEQGRILGSLDVPLCQRGLDELTQTADELVGIPIGVVISSACQAAKQSAALMAAKFDLKVKVEKKLLNLDCGLWHGKSLDELRETQPTLFKQWKEHPEQICPPGGETLATVQNRVATVVKKLRKKYKSGVILIVAPEPLLTVIRNELQRELGDEKPIRLKCGQWEMIEADRVTA
jgi:probable phosphoglycerate mutase